MADGIALAIDIRAQLDGVSTSATELNALASSLDAASGVATKFDSSIEQTKALLAQAGEIATSASEAVAAGSTKYNQLEAAATKAAKAVERMALKGGDTSALQAEADAAKVALQAQAAALDELKAASEEANAAQNKLKNTLKSLEGAATDSTKEFDDGKRSLKDLAKQAAGPAGETIEKLSGAMGLLANPTAAAAVAIGAVALASIAMAAAVAAGVVALIKYSVTLNKVAMEKLSKATEKAKGNLAKLFSGVHVDKFVTAYEDVLDLLDESNSAAQGVKAILSAMLNPLFDSSTALAPIVKELFRGLVLGALLTAVAVVKAKNALAKLLPSGLMSNIDWLKTALVAGQYAFYALAAAVAVSAVVLGILFVACVVGLAFVLFAVLALPLAFMIAIAAVLALGYAIYYFGSKAISAIGAFVSSAVSYLASLASSAYNAGANIIQGLLNSISSGTGMVLDALRNLGGGAINALKGALGIHSPSKFAIEFGKNITETFSGTIEDGSGDSNAAMETMAEPPDMPSFEGSRAQSAKQSSGASSGSSVSVVGPFNFYGVAGAEDAESRFSAMFTRILEGDVTQLGGEVPAT